MVIGDVIDTSYRNCTHFDVDSSWKCNPAYQGPNMPQWLCHWRGRYPDAVVTSSCEKFRRNSTTNTRVMARVSRGVQNLYACLLKTSPRAKTHWKGLTFFSLSIHLVIACLEDPVRSLRAAIASLMSPMVAMFEIPFWIFFAIQRFFFLTSQKQKIDSNFCFQAWS